MIKQPLVFPEGAQMTRANAASVVQAASRFEARIMIERKQKIVNAKSTLGLLSLYTDIHDSLTLLADGPDEEAAAAAVQEAVAALR